MNAVLYRGGVAHAWVLGAALAAFMVTPAPADETLPGLPDPTRPSYGGEAVEHTGTSAGPVLQSTMVAPGRKRAVISGRSYSVGDKLGAAVITDIQPYEVVLSQGGRETRMRLLPRLAQDARAGGDKVNKNVDKTK